MIDGGPTDDERWIRIDDSLRIPRSELVYRATRAGGPGGQHVNTSSTRIELTWNVAASPSLTDAQRARLLKRLATRLDTSGVLRLTAAGTRSQAQNKADVTERFRRMIGGALRMPKPRKRTKPPRSARESRLKAKRRRSELKQGRGRVEPSE